MTRVTGETVMYVNDLSNLTILTQFDPPLKIRFYRHIKNNWYFKKSIKIHNFGGKVKIILKKSYQ